MVYPPHMRVCACTRRKCGFTLVELLTVMAILALLAAMLMPGIQAALDRARVSGCTSNLRQIGAAIQLWRADYDGFLPATDGHNQPNNRLSENPNGYNFSVELQLHMQGADHIGHVSAWTPHYGGQARKLDTWICPADTIPAHVQKGEDMRRVSYGPTGYAWQVAIRRVRGVSGSLWRDHKLHPAWIETEGGQGPSGIVVVSEATHHNGILVNSSLTLVENSFLPGGYELREALRPSHNRGRGVNLLYLDGHTRYVSDYMANYASDFRGLMWGFFR